MAEYIVSDPGIPVTIGKKVGENVSATPIACKECSWANACAGGDRSIARGNAYQEESFSGMDTLVDGQFGTGEFDGVRSANTRQRFEAQIGAIDDFEAASNDNTCLGGEIREVITTHERANYTRAGERWAGHVRQFGLRAVGKAFESHTREVVVCQNPLGGAALAAGVCFDRPKPYPGPLA